LIHALSADYTMGLNEAGNVEIKIFFIESADLQAFTPFTVDPDSVSVVDCKICVEFASEDRAEWHVVKSHFTDPSGLLAIQVSSVW
tara:strand:- start:343 stop:600 length:258 start_codon:yes stop_codon:yes gene_type:complete